VRLSDRRTHALSPDGRRIAYDSPSDELVVRDLVSGESYSLAFPNSAAALGISAGTVRATT
jgi:hypothetical protein